MTVRFTDDALRHVAAIRSHIEASSAYAATRIVERIFVEADRLGALPYLGHPGQVAGTRERTIPGLPYVMVYQPGDGEQLIVLGVYHGAQQR